MTLTVRHGRQAADAVTPRVRPLRPQTGPRSIPQPLRRCAPERELKSCRRSVGAVLRRSRFRMRRHGVHGAEAMLDERRAAGPRLRHLARSPFAWRWVSRRSRTGTVAGPLVGAARARAARPTAAGRVAACGPRPRCARPAVLARRPAAVGAPPRRVTYPS